MILQGSRLASFTYNCLTYPSVCGLASFTYTCLTYPSVCGLASFTYTCLTYPSVCGLVVVIVVRVSMYESHIRHA